MLTVRSQPSRSVSPGGGVGWPPIPALFTAWCRAPELLQRVRHGPLVVLAYRGVLDEPGRRAAGVGDLLDDHIDRVGMNVGHQHLRALAGEVQAIARPIPPDAAPVTRATRPLKSNMSPPRLGTHLGEYQV